MTSETLAVVFMCAYVCVGASGVLLHSIEQIQAPGYGGLEYASVRTDGYRLWSYGAEGTFLLAQDGSLYLATVGTVYQCAGRYTVVPGVLPTDAYTVRCFELGGQLDGSPQGEEGAGDRPEVLQRLEDDCERLFESSVELPGKCWQGLKRSS
jgi:hypothetical protein